MKSTRKIITIVIITALIIARFLYLDQDAPAYMIGGITQEDEPYYCLGAISRYNADQDRVIKGLEHINGDGLMLYSSHIVYLSLKVFGNTYWGLRLPCVLISLCIILLLYDILRRQKVDKTILLLVMLYMFTDFYFFLFSRFETPQIYSMLAITWVLWLYFKYGMASNRGIFLIGFFVFFSVSFIYAYNAFLIMVFGLLSVFQSCNQKSVKPLVFFSSGIITCMLLYLGTLMAINSSVGELITVLSGHGGGIEGVKSSEMLGMNFLAHIKNIYGKLIQLPVTNLFRYNLSVLLLFFFTFPFMFRQVLREKSEKHLMFLLFVFALILQSYLAVSYPFKKLIVVFPVVVLVLADVLTEALKYYKQFDFRKKIYLVICMVIILVLCSINFKLNNSKAYWDVFNLGYYDNTGGLYNILNLMVLAVTFSLLLMHLFFAKVLHRGVLIAPVSIGIVLISIYCFNERSFCSRDGFKRAAGLLENKGVITSVCYSGQFYTHSRPGLGCYMDRSIYGNDYEAMAERLFETGAAEFTIEKVKLLDSNKTSENPALEKIMVIPMTYYQYHIYKYAQSQKAGYPE